jgi:hypothetical protein
VMFEKSIGSDDKPRNSENRGEDWGFLKCNFLNEPTLSRHCGRPVSEGIPIA